jgi:hypothetical protein
MHLMISMIFGAQILIWDMALAETNNTAYSEVAPAITSGSSCLNDCTPRDKETAGGRVDTES